jgi:hypothetical protein
MPIAAPTATVVPAALARQTIFDMPSPFVKRLIAASGRHPAPWRGLPDTNQQVAAVRAGNNEEA